MKILKYFIEFIFIIFLFTLFKILGFKLSSNIGGQIGKLFGPFFRSRKKILLNVKKAFPNVEEKKLELIINNMWKNYGRILSEYVFIKDFRNSKLDKFISIEGQDILNKIKEEEKPVIFISGHFSNFELMAMHIEKSGIKLAAIYRPLNNIFLNKIMERIRKKHICQKQIQKGRMGTRELLEAFKENYSIALMIDQRVSEGIKSDFFGSSALTTTIPAQIVKKFGCRIVPVYVERSENFYFKIKFNSPILYDKNVSIEKITLDLNKWLEKQILNNPSQWIWSHNRWK